MTITDYDNELPYDGDLNDDSQRCQHGTFIGSWWGPDYLCWACEEGISVEEYRAYQERVAARRRRELAISMAFDQIFDVWRTFRGFKRDDQQSAFLRRMLIAGRYVATDEDIERYVTA